VLVVEHEPAGPVVVAVDVKALAAAGRPVLATWRVGGSTPLARADLDVALAVVLSQVRRLRDGGVDVVGVEIDHDCATARLPAYRDLLVELRGRLGPGLRLAVTALPTWRDDPTALRALGGVVDEMTVQVHAMRAPRLFEPDTAVADAVAFARTAGRDVGVALPTYAARPRDGALMRVDAVEVADVARRLRGAPGISRLAWFRLGADDDAAAFPASTLEALLSGAPLRAAIVVETVAAPDGAIDVVIANRGSAPGPAPRRLPFPSPSPLAEAAPGVVVDGAAFVLGDDVILPAGARRRLGWIRPSSALESL
jgi:hypothetical protein